MNRVHNVWVAGIGVVAFFSYAHKDAMAWKNGWLSDLRNEKPFQEWTHDDVGSISTDSNPPALTVGIPQPGIPFLFYVRAQVERGKLGFQIRDSEGGAIAPPTYTAGVGMNHCFLGWTPEKQEEIQLHIWEAEARDYPDHYDRKTGEFFYESYRHFGFVDLAKLEFFPKDRIEVSASFFPNGHETIPYLLNKERATTNEASALPKYWAAGAPCWSQVAFEAPREINRVVCQLPNQKMEIAPPHLQLRLKNQKVFRSPMTLEREVRGKGREVVFRFQKIQAVAARVKFEEAGNDLGIAYLQDVSIPQPAKFSVDKVMLLKGTNDQVYPRSLSFLLNEEE